MNAVPIESEFSALNQIMRVDSGGISCCSFSTSPVSPGHSSESD